MNAKKLEELIVYLGSHPKVENLGLTKLWKLIYFIDSESFRDGGELITDSEFIKYQHGPVPSRGEKILGKLVKSGAVTTTPVTIGTKILNEVKAARKPDESQFSPRELQIMDSTSSKYGGYTAIALSKISHKEPAWHYAEKMGKLSPSLMKYGWSEDPEGL